ncbi:murein hydrolase activator EnvC family protein [Thermohalobacter berrensis]|uniref:Peptidase M23 n=1 Tax=Thermohalobacter berrensis TaxID=99594 RepID=A0A419SXU9_9FIRM|nr:M23 family metallopeptidase [Thermohalobacter berrensis]RKD30090.1 peptidase M23 [Thermohalobacter berrensis]
MVSKRFTIVLVLILLINTIIVYADGDISNEKQRLNEVNKNISELKEKIEEKKEEYKDITREIERLDLQVDRADKELKKVEGEIKNIENKIDETKAKLEEAENNIREKNDVLNKRLRVIYKNGTVGYLEVLLASKDIGDLLTRIDMVQKIIEHDIDLLKFMKQQREIIAQEKENLEKEREMLKVARKKAEEKREKLLLATRAKKRMMEKLKDNIEELEKQEDSLIRQAKKLEQEIRRKQLSGKYAGGKLAWPAPGYYRITSPFGPRFHPILRKQKLHTGIDIGVPLGRKIVAANDGVVQHAGWLGGYGKVVIIDHGGGITTLYAHNSRLLVRAGQRVRKGQAIALAGSTGYSTGPHLHFEVRVNGKYVNPLPWLKGDR